jgi:hypothetical protein
MSDVLEVRRQVAIAGRVVDTRTGQPLRGARVEITQGPEAFTRVVQWHGRMHGTAWEAKAERIDRTHAAADGHFHFLDLPPGAYTLRAVLPAAGSRYGTAEQQATVIRTPDGSLQFGTAELGIQATTLVGRILSTGGDPVIMAEVRIGGSGESTLSGADGRYTLAAVETGSRTAAVSARGFQSAALPVTLATPGATQTLDFTLTPSP